MWSCVLFAYAVAMATIFAGVAALDPAGSRLTEEEMTLLLRRARESRHGRQSQQTNLGKAKAFYKKVIEGGDGKLQGEAMFELSEMIESEPGFMTSQSSKTVSIDLLMRAAEAGHPAAQHSLSIAYATGLHNGIVPMDAGRALILEYMAALGGDPEANMGMGYRYMKGIGVQENCLSAVAHYEYAANAAVNQISERGYAYHIEHSKLSDIEKATVKGKREFDREIIDYYTNLANEGDWQAATSLSNIYIHGSRLVDQNLGKATKFLEMAVRGGSPTAAGLLGYLMLTRGDHKNGTTILEAKRLIQGAANRGEAHGCLGMGWMYYTGKGMERNLVKAEDWFNKAAAKHADASFYLGEIHLGQEHGSGASPSPSPRNQPQKKSPKHMNTAIQYFVQATQRGHPLAAHRIAQMSAIGKGLQKVCHEALIGYKSSAERGDWAASLTTAHRLYDAGDRLGALRLFTRMAAVGVESAQFNAALILSRMTCSQGLVYNPPLHPDMTATSQGNTVEVHVGRDGDPITEESDGYFGSSSRDDVRINTAKVVRLHPSNWTSALTNSSEDVSDGIIDVSSVSLGRANCELRGMFLLGLSAQQQNAEAYLRVGDIHYYGSAGMARDKVEAAVYYQMAADLRHTHAIFNLGIMHEAGDGVQQDFHLAKRFYDQAAMVDTEARLPRAFALALLESHKSLHEMLGPDVAEMFLARPISWLQTLCASLGRNTFTGSGDNVLVDKGVGGNRSRGVSAVIADLMQFVRSDILGYTDDALESQYYTEKGPLADLDSDISDDSDGALHKIKTLYYYAVRLVDSLVHAVVWKDINPFGAWQPGISITVGNPTPDSAKDVGWLEEEQQTQSSGPLASIRNFDINDTESTSYSVVLIILILVMVMVYQLRAARIRRRRDAWDRQRQEMLLRE